ncbi:hypothetical protein PAXRUDRAFT_825358 [Paxillus rubicundulus Ve08.2h10]|uniref:Uncharacterized protein n=1 Tax=Paxillus rubicundulus Ve08.2h10 TaxID=930991 RepID=A0A0D0E6C3_9AGAM|nr:hypothetical protein PAXRUDRAFT_825358 [Paxillus rubicundulus Ve08.2h10]
MDPEILPQVIPDHRWRGSPQIIDVDAPNVDDIVYVRSSPPRQRRRVAEGGRAVPVPRQVIHITDSDDDEEIQFVGSNPPRPQHPRPVRRERIFSPPPPPQMDGIPPVPPIPERFLPLPHRPPPGLVIANEVPFPFEADLGLGPHPAEGPSTPTPPPVAAPPSRHLPFMGFGGALLTGVRQVIRPSHRNGLGPPGAVVMRWDPFDLFGAEGRNMLDDDSDGVAVWQDVDVPFPAGGVGRQLDRAFERRHNEPLSEPDYKPEYTHPNKPLPGFTHDFAPTSPSSPSPSVIVLDDSPGSSSASASCSQPSDAALVCVSCRDPLVLGASDIAEGRNRRRLWGLRCGHIFDGKCVEKLMKPSLPAFDQTQTPSHVDQKGKGRMIPETLDLLLSSGQDDAEDVVMDVNSMRSRLRPRRGMPGSMPSVPQPGQPLYTRHRGVITARPRIIHRSRGKGKGKAKALFVEAEHAWSCPVNGCGLVHLSLLIDGRWTMDEKRGAIAVFA